MLGVCQKQNNSCRIEMELSNINFAFSVIGVSETVQITNPENLFRSQKRGGGVLLFIRNGIEYKRRTGLDILLDKIEAIFIERKK